MIKFHVRIMSLWPFLIAIGSCTPNEGANSLKAQNLRPRFVEAQEAQVKPFEREMSFVGIASPTEMVSLHFAVAGRLESCNYKDGDLVKMGDIICGLDTAIIDLEIERAQTALDAARKVLSSNFIERQRKLYKDGVIGQLEFERARIEYETAVAQQRDTRSLLELAQRKKAEHLLRAPWGGRVSGLAISPGQLLSPELRIGFLTARPLHDIHRIEVKMHASRFGTVRIGDAASLHSVAGKNLASPGKGSVIKIAQSIDPASQTFKVHVDVEMPEKANIPLTEGMLVRGKIHSQISKSAIVIPASSLIQWSSANEALIYTVDKDGRLAERSITVSDYANDEILVTEGLSQGESIVVRYAADLYHGMPVETKGLASSDRSDTEHRESVQPATEVNMTKDEP